MRRSFALVLASLTLGTGSLLFAAQGCSTTALGVQDLCGWLGDECNCYRRFSAGVVTAGGEPMCGVKIVGDEAVDASGNAFNPPESKPTTGKFAKREKLDICVLSGKTGGQIKFDPALDVTQFPPTTLSFTIIDGTGKECGHGSYSGSNSFSIGFPAPEGSGGTGGTGGSTGGGGSGGSTTTTTAGGVSCRESQDKNPADDPIASGTFTIAGTDVASVVTTTCPNGEEHRFNLFQLDKCDGTGAEESFKAIMPTAEIEASTGGVDIRGHVRLRIFWPPTTGDLNGAKPLDVEYFDCSFPGDVDPCTNGVQDGDEVAQDCGYIACGGGCKDADPCTINEDCTSGDCHADDKGVLLCFPSACGDGLKTGLESCDDGNMVAGDGCSDLCKQEGGYTCTGEGVGSCVDIDECATNTDNCAASATCVNNPGSFTCMCNAGFSSDGMGCFPNCGDGDKQPPEGCDDGNTAGGDGCSANCAAETGFKCMGEGPGSCVDIDECATMTSTCNKAENCVNTVPGFMCQCTKTLTKVCSGTCIDVSEDVFNCGDCLQECQANQTCVMGVCTGP